MKKNTSQKLPKRLSNYGALSLAIAGITNASDQIIYTDIPDEIVSSGNVFYLDVNNDSYSDIILLAYNSSTYTKAAFCLPGGYSYSGGNRISKIVGLNPGNYFYYPSNMSKGEVINPANDTFYGFGQLNIEGCAGSRSQFCDGQDGYVGLHMKVGSSTYYGWVRIQVAANGSSITVKDYAYESAPGVTIAAGDTGVLGMENSLLNTIRIVVLNKSINLYNVPERTTYKALNMSGKEVLKGITNTPDHVIEAATLASGIYIVELADPSSRGLIRKKVVLK
ncbi:hypothetical protein ACFO5O_08435 [Geojedonia litorea]|uniref:Por secretion system C-terminal sorting domain-containing protein n=1 Tax=Geojedonia litorea TaxID=1268269 RepID=A0ABV9N253_9FLAO